GRPARASRRSPARVALGSPNAQSASNDPRTASPLMRDHRLEPPARVVFHRPAIALLLHAAGRADPEGIHSRLLTVRQPVGHPVGGSLPGPALHHRFGLRWGVRVHATGPTYHRVR